MNMMPSSLIWICRYFIIIFCYVGRCWAAAKREKKNCSVGRCCAAAFRKRDKNFLAEVLYYFVIDKEIEIEYRAFFAVDNSVFLEGVFCNVAN